MDSSARGAGRGRGAPPPRRRGVPPGDPVTSRGSGDRSSRGGKPDVAADVNAGELPAEVRAELRSLPAGLAEQVTGHLVMAGRLVEEDPAAAHEHSQAARALASRVAAVREAAGITAYRAGRYAEALAELRAARRMTGSPEYLPLIADCERGLGRPQRALVVAEDPDAARLDRAGRVELRIVAAGARRDLGQLDAALMMLRGPELEPAETEDWTVRLWYAYADTLLAAGHRDEAREWFRAAASVDDDSTDAEERLFALSAGDGEGRPDARGQSAPE